MKKISKCLISCAKNPSPIINKIPYLLWFTLKITWSWNLFFYWFYGLILNHVHWIILMWQLHNDPLVVNRWLLPASDPLTILTLICLFHPLLIVRFHWYLPLQHPIWRHDFVVTGGGVLLLQDYLRAASLPAATPAVRGMVRGWLLVLLVIVYDWGVMGGILTFFLAIRLL